MKRTAALRQSFECAARGCDRLINNVVCMRDADEPSLELRRCEINAFGKHGVEKPAVQFPVALVCGRPVCDGFSGEEAGPH